MTIAFKLLLEHDNDYIQGDWNEYIKDKIKELLCIEEQIELIEVNVELLEKASNKVLLEYLDWKEEQDIISPRDLLIDTINNLTNNLPNVYPQLDYTAEDYLRKAMQSYYNRKELNSIKIIILKGIANRLINYAIKNPFINENRDVLEKELNDE